MEKKTPSPCAPSRSVVSKKKIADNRDPPSLLLLVIFNQRIIRVSRIFSLFILTVPKNRFFHKYSKGFTNGGDGNGPGLGTGGKTSFGQENFAPGDPRAGCGGITRNPYGVGFFACHPPGGI